MNIFFMLMAILAGIFTTIEASINSQLGKYLTPGVATLHSLITGMLFFFLLSFLNGNLSNYQKAAQVSPIWLIGGFFGAMIIYLSSKSIPVLGISNTLILIISAELLCSLVVEAVLLNQAINVKKILGLIIFLVGAIMYLQD